MSVTKLEKAVQQLEDNVAALEHVDTPLTDAINHYKKAIKAGETALKELDSVKNQIKKITNYDDAND